MGFLDKVKEQAATASAVAKDAAQKGQAKLDEMQNKRAADALLRDLGAVVYAEQTGRSTATAAADVERLTGALHEHEEAHGPIDLGLEAPTGGNAPWPPPPPGAQPPQVLGGTSPADERTATATDERTATAADPSAVLITQGHR